MSTALAPVAAASESTLFQGVPDKHFNQLGVDEDTVRIARLLPDESHLDALAMLLSRDLVEEVDAQEVDPEDLASAIRRSPDQAVFVEGPEELRELLEHPFDVWRTFLHPRQERIARRNGFAGPAMVTGGAGTGKTVTALHRVAHLIERYAPDWRQLTLDTDQAAPEQPILFTTFTTTLDTALRAQLELLVRDEDRRALVDVRNLDKVAHQVVRRVHGRLDFPHRRELTAQWDRHAEDLEVSGRFLLEEWEQVILAQDLLYQRPYSWGRQELERLWDDLTEQVERDEETRPGGSAGHFLGSVVPAPRFILGEHVDPLVGDRRPATTHLLVHRAGGHPGSSA